MSDAPQIPTRWETPRLVVEDSVEAELPALQRVFDDTGYIGEWAGFADPRENPMASELRHESLPPGGAAERHRLQSVKLKLDGQVIGFLVAYHGFPDEREFWVATFAMHPSVQKRGLGPEAIAGLVEWVKSSGYYRSMALSVAIKNWPALRFWVGAGFDRITRFNGPAVCAEDAFATIWLRQSL